MALEQVVITDAATGSQATVLVGFGFNCYRYVARVDGTPIDVIWSPPGFENGTGKPSLAGIPLLFPYPGRLRGKTLTYNEQTYELSGDNRGNAIHGYVLNRPWEVVEQTASRIVGRFEASKRDASILKQWPADFRLTVSYEVLGTKLLSTITIENPDSKSLPYGFGAHPYFRVPLGPDGSPDACVVTVPTQSYWELVDMLPTGRKLPAKEKYDLGAGMRFNEMRFDDVFTDIAFHDHRALASIVDPVHKRSLTLAFDDGFTECVVYNPAHREAVCLEPYTCVPDQFSMAEKGAVGEPQTLAPGKSFSASYEIRVD